MKLRRWQLASVSVALTCACGAAAPHEPETAAHVAPPPMASTRSGMQVEGLLGTIPQRKIEAALQAELPAFQRCFFQGAREVEMISGYIKFYFRVALDGRVEWVHPRGSSVGHRATEACLLTRAARVRFPEPKGGGPAEFVWGFEFDNSEGVRPPVAWETDQVLPVIEAHRGSLEACAVGEPGHYKVTVYVSPGGTVLGAGAAADSQPAAEHLDCITETVRGWPFPDPGSYAAKVTFGL